MCGNWGLLSLAEYASRARSRGEPLPERLERLLRQVLLVVEMRGAQAGGLTLSLGGSAQTTRVRALKPKRGSLGERIFQSLHKQLWRRNMLSGLRLCAKPSSDTVLVQGHSRFGTSSNPAVIETHPHQWSPAARVRVWRWDEGEGWTGAVRNCQLTVTHNGDFDAWRPYQDTVVDVGSLNHWLSRVLGCSNLAVGDSPKIAGVLELLVCQGVWLHAVRYAYHLHVACHVEQACGWEQLGDDAPRTVPTEQVFATWAEVFEKEFEELLMSGLAENERSGQREPLAMNSGSLACFLCGAKESLLAGKRGQTLRKWVPAAKLDHFILSTTEAFRDNDLLAAGTTFLQRATGTFGISVISSLYPGTVVLAARGQPMSVGFGGPSASLPALVTWASEPSSLHGLTKQGDVHARFDLDDRWGEVLELSAARFHCSEEDVECGSENSGRFVASLKGSAKLSPGEEFFEMRGMRFRAQSTQEACVPKVLSQRSFRSRLTWLVTQPDKADLAGDPRRPSTSSTVSHASPTLEGRDLVGGDISQIPAVLHDVDLAWSDEESLNSTSAVHFAELLLAGLRRPEREDETARRIDLLVFGVENSLWLAQQFCADLTRMFPKLHAVAMSSNALLGMLQTGPGHLTAYNWVYDDVSACVGPHTVGLALSHSGTTYPTVWATRLMRGRTEHVFSMAGSFDCLLASSAGQAPGQPFTRRLFATLGGIRPAEAATATTVAMQHTLSHLILRCCAVATQTEVPTLKNHSRTDIVNGSCDSEYLPVAGDAEAAGAAECVATPQAVLCMHRLVLSLYWGASSACATDADGRRMKGDDLQHNRELRKMGTRWSHHITEGYWGVFLPALYVLLTVTAGVAPVSFAFKAKVEAIEKSHGISVHPAWFWLFRFVDAFIYVMLPVMVMMTHRFFTGRRVWARFTTRSLVIVESTMNYKLLRAYVSKLLALSWRFAGLNVAGQNGTDQFVHEFTHKAQSDCLLAVGLPDGRLPSTAVAQHATLLSVQQAKFIKKSGRGIECYSMGHNPWRRPGLFMKSKVLDTFRPRFVSERLFDHGDSAEGTAPHLVMQQWHELLTRQLDPVGVPKISITFANLKRLAGGVDTLDLDSAARVLEDLIGQQEEHVPLGLKSFLESYCSQPAFKSEVYVHSAKKGFKSAVDYSSQCALQGGADVRAYLASIAPRGHALNARLDSALTPIWTDRATTPASDDVSPRISNISPTAPVRGEKTTWSRASRTMAAWKNSTPNDRGSLDLNELMALLHGDELQGWIRSMRFRWHKMQRVRGVLAFIPHRIIRNQSANHSVLPGGTPLREVFASWKQSARPAMSARESMFRQESPESIITVEAASLQEAGRRKRRQNWDMPTASPTSHGRRSDLSATPRGEFLIGGDLAEKNLDEKQVLEQSRLREQFYETRVGSTERLIGWFVLFHAMAEPVSRLPGLRFDLGKTESRLRVASTPAPVAMVSAEDPLQSKQAAAAADLERGDSGEDLEWSLSASMPFW